MPASAGTWVVAFSGSGTSLTSGSIGTSTVGDNIWAVTADGNNGTAPTGSDSQSNTGWGQLGTAQVDAATSARMTVNYTQNIANAGAGHTITATWGSSNNIGLIAGFITGTAGSGAVDTGSMTQAQDTTSPYQLTSNAPAQNDNYWISFYLPPDAGLGTEVFTQPSSWAILNQATDRNTRYCFCVAGKAIDSSSAQSVTWADTSTTGNRQIKIVAVKSAASGTTVALTGVSETSAVGTMSVAVDKALTGVSETSAVGSVGVVVDKALTGVSETSAVGTMGVSVSKALTGVSETSAVGTMGVSVSKALTGVSETSAVGSVGVVVDKALSGVQATGQAGQPGVDVTVALTGVQTTGQVGTVTPVVGQSVDLTGVQTTGHAGQVGVDVTVALTGVQATGQVGSMTPGVPPPVGSAPTALRRWLIQQYTEYFEEVERAKEEATKEAERAPSRTPRPQKRKSAYQVPPQTPPEDDLSRAIELAMRELSARRATAARLVRLERSFGVELPPLPKLPTPPTEQGDEDEDLALLLAAIHNL